MKKQIVKAILCCGIVILLLSTTSCEKTTRGKVEDVYDELACSIADLKKEISFLEDAIFDLENSIDNNSSKIKLKEKIDDIKYCCDDIDDVRFQLEDGVLVDLYGIIN